MPRMSDAKEQARERYENALACMAAALLHLELVELRIERAARQQPGLLGPALDEIDTIKSKLSKAQKYIC